MVDISNVCIAVTLAQNCECSSAYARITVAKQMHLVEGCNVVKRLGVMYLVRSI